MAIDLTEAVEAAAKAAWEQATRIPDVPWEEAPPMLQHRVRATVLEPVTAAAAVIEAAVRAEVEEAAGWEIRDIEERNDS